MQKAIFIDRDGVINKDPGGWTRYNYVTKWEEFFFIDGAIEALKMLKKAGYRICLISNQGGISKGYFSQRDLDELNKRMLGEIEEAGAGIDELYYCPHHDKDSCECRKPKTGLIERAMKRQRFDPRRTFIIGDSVADIEAGKKMGMKTVLVLSGKTPLSDVDAWPVKPDAVKADLREAAEWIVNSEENR